MTALDRIIGVQPVHGRDAVRRHWERSSGANDNTPQPKGDRWARLIMGWSSVKPAFGLYAYRARQAGEDFDTFVARTLKVMEGAL